MWRSRGCGAYWLHIDELREIRRFGTVKAEALEDGVYVDSKKCPEDIVDLSRISFYPANQPVPIYINKSEVFRGIITGEKLSFFTTDNQDGRK